MAGHPARDEIVGRLGGAVPSVTEGHPAERASAEADGLLDRAFHALEVAAQEVVIELSTTSSPTEGAGHRLTREEFRRGAGPMGTLGSGNHFIELLAGSYGAV